MEFNCWYLNDEFVNVRRAHSTSLARHNKQHVGAGLRDAGQVADVRITLVGLVSDLRAL
jgi:hypothetical protein